MSRREHVVLRVGALVVLALCAWLPRGLLAAAPASATGARSVVLTSAPVGAATLATLSLAQAE